MVKGKYRYHFADGSTMTDKNGYKTLAGARSWAKSHNMSPRTNKSDKVIRITEIKKNRK